MSTIKIDAATLAADAAWIAKGKAKSSYVPLLTTTRVAITDAGLQLRATDLDLWREVNVPADGAVAHDVAVLVDPAKLAAFLKGAKGEAVVSVDTTGVEIVIGSRTVTIPATDGDISDYPQWPEFVATDEPAVLTVQQVKAALVSAGKDDTLPMLTGVRFDNGDLATTDRFRLTLVSHAAEGFTALVPASTLRPFTVGKGSDITVEIGTVGDPGDGTPERPRNTSVWSQVSRDSRTIVGRNLDAEFPKFRQLIPSEPTVIAEVHRTDLLAALGGVGVDLTLHAGGTMTVDGRDSRDTGEVITSQTIAADVASEDGLPFTVRMAVEYLTAALKSFTADVIELSFTTPTRPIVLTADGELHLIMPWRIPS